MTDTTRVPKPTHEERVLHIMFYRKDHPGQTTKLSAAEVEAAMLGLEQRGLVERDRDDDGNVIMRRDSYGNLQIAWVVTDECWAHPPPTLTIQ
jgi:hypothetical protein